MVQNDSGMRVSIVFADKNYWKFVNGYKFNLDEMHGMVNGLISDIVKDSLKKSIGGGVLG